jgi:hypothetical protein
MGLELIALVDVDYPAMKVLELNFPEPTVTRTEELPSV